MNVEENAVFLLRVTLETKNLELLNQASGSLYAVQELADLTSQIPFRLAVPVFKGTAVEEVHQHFRHPVEHTYHGIGLQSQVIPIEQSLGRESHHLAVLLHHRNQANLLDSFYLDFPNLMESYEYLLLLPCTEWSVEGKPVVMERGIHERTTIPEEPTRAFFQNYDVMSVIDREVMDIYSKHFLKVSQSFPFDSSWKKNLPDILRSCFKEAVLEKMQDKLVWVKIQFPAHFTPEVLEELHAGINIVPVENKTLHEQTTPLEDTFRVVPLRTGNHESLLSVHSVKDSDGKTYHELLYPEKDSTESNGTYSIRKGGCERFDSRSAKELLGYLSDLLDDETHAFHAVSSIKLQALTTQMEQLMAQMKQTADSMNESRETPYYLMIDQLSGKGQITVKYWTTNCEVGNRIQAGVNLSPNATTYLDSKTLALVSTTYGGKQAPKNREQIDIYKYGFISHGRILTQNDIASFCKKELGELLVRTEIRNGVEISPMPHEGLVRTKEVHLILGTKLDEPSQEKQIKDNLRTKLSACSPDTFNYRIFIEYNKA